MAITRRRIRHGEDVKYIAYVLWLVGFSERSISIVLRIRKKQAAGIISASGYANRSAMTIGERQRKLDELRAIRFDDDGFALDRGRLDRCTFEARPLRDAQRRGPTRRRMRG